MDAVERATATVRAFRAVDEFAVEGFRAARTFGDREGDAVALELRRSLARCGGAIVAATVTAAGEQERRLDEARVALYESRYYLYLARRLGLLDLRQYRALSVRHDAAVREIESKPP